MCCCIGIVERHALVDANITVTVGETIGKKRN
jgi:hypothetical protein